MSDPLDEALDHLGRHAGRAGQTITSEVARQIQRANDDRRRTLLDAQRKAEREREQAAREAAKEKDRTDRLAARYGTPSSSETPATATTAAASGEPAEPATAAGPSRAERERRLLEGAGFDPDKRATPEEIEAREEKRRTEHRDTTRTRGDEGLER